jgi:hypothetical protein
MGVSGRTVYTQSQESEGGLVVRAIDSVLVRSPALEWRKSRASENGENCVEVAVTGPSVWIRDSRDKAGPVLVVEYGRWREFVERVRDGELTGG